MTAKNDQPNDTTTTDPHPPAPKMHLPLFFWGTFLMIALSLAPLALAKPGTNHADHNLAMLAFWSMSAGLVRGFGYIPAHKIARWLLGGWAAVGSAVAAVALWLMSGGWAIVNGL